MANLVKDMDTSVLEAFASQIRGKVVLPEDSNYENTRKVYNAMIDKRPGMIVKCVDVADVIYAVNSFPRVTGSASIKCVLPIFLNDENCFDFFVNDFINLSIAGMVSLRLIRIATCIAVGYVSLLDCDMFT